jgi:hypothetical protein
MKVRKGAHLIHYVASGVQERPHATKAREGVLGVDGPPERGTVCHPGNVKALSSFIVRAPLRKRQGDGVSIKNCESRRGKQSSMPPTLGRESHHNPVDGCFAARMYLCRNDELYLRLGDLAQRLVPFDGQPIGRTQFPPTIAIQHGKISRKCARLFFCRGLRVYPTLSSLTRRQRGETGHPRNFNSTELRNGSERLSRCPMKRSRRTPLGISTKTTLKNRETRERTRRKNARTCWSSAFLCPPP